MLQKGDCNKRQVKYNSKGEKDCYHCGADDHWATKCPLLSKDQQGQLKDGAMALQHGAIMSQAKVVESAAMSGGVKKNYLYADTCSTNDFMVNPTYLTGVHTVTDLLHIHTNVGMCTTKQQGFLGSAPFWLDKNGIANVISLRSLETKHRVTYDSTKHGGAFIIHTPKGEVYFRRCPDMGFPYIDLDDSLQGATMLLQTIRDAVPTIRGNYEGFTKQEITKAQEA